MKDKMSDKIQDKFKDVDLNFITKLIFYSFFISVLIVTFWAYIDAPVQHHFKYLRKNEVWFGSGWTNAETGENADTYRQRLIRLTPKDGYSLIEKTMDFTPETEEYVCFRVPALEIRVYVNGEVWYEYHTSDKYGAYGGQLKMLHQVSVAGIKKGDKIALELRTEEKYENVVVEFPAVGDRYALVVYLMTQSRGSFVVCVIALVLMLLAFLVGHSVILVNKEHDKTSLRWLTSFLGLSALYIAMDSGCMEIFLEKTPMVIWFANLSMMIIPTPFVMFMKYAFFPGHKRYMALAFIDFIITATCIATFLMYSYDMSNFYIYIHVLIVAGIICCILSFAQERTMPSLEVFLGFGAIISGAFLSVAFYWNKAVYPASIAYGYGLVGFSLCMIIWMVRSRHELNRMREEASYLIMERDKVSAQEASEQKSRFLTSMSHEIRTPLNAILGLNELIMRGTTDSSIKKHSADIQASGRTLLALINDVLDFSKIETGKMDILPTEYSLSSLLNDIVIIVQERAKSSSLELRLDIDSTIPDLLYGDEVRIKQIIINLMTNAVKYTKDGWVELCVKRQKASEFLDDDDIVLDIRVTDTGIGIKKEELSKLFVEFERLDRIANRSVEGTGLGLSITSRLASLMNGKINVESEYGKGSTFRVWIPQRVVSDVPIGDYKHRFERLSSEKNEETPEITTFPGKRVFVVDDNEMNLEVIASILEMLEIEVERAGGGQAAIEKLDREAYDLILTDDMMPEVSGTDLMLYLHTHSGSASHSTPIVVLTANAISGAREEYVKKGFDDYMTKPIDVEVLQKILMKYLK